VVNYNDESFFEPRFLFTKLTESVSLSGHINSETTSKCHLYCNPLTDFVNLVDRKQVQEVICNYNLPQGSSMSFFIYNKFTKKTLY
jgi:hypothetical protein